MGFNHNKKKLQTLKNEKLAKDIPECKILITCKGKNITIYSYNLEDIKISIDGRLQHISNYKIDMDCKVSKTFTLLELLNHRYITKHDVRDVKSNTYSQLITKFLLYKKKLL